MLLAIVAVERVCNGGGPQGGGYGTAYITADVTNDRYPEIRLLNILLCEEDR
jgi:hypothetical protein